jgi:Holliday junction resolvase RusA-like endonuclease
MPAIEQLEFFVYGIPKGQPRGKPFRAPGGHARIFDPGTANTWKSAVADAAKPFLPERPRALALEGPLLLRVDLFFPRPKDHYTKKGNQLKLGSPSWHTKVPDADNLAKAVMDTLTAMGVWRDDSQIAELVTKKFYAADPTEAGARIHVSQLAAP